MTQTSETPACAPVSILQGRTSIECTQFRLKNRASLVRCNVPNMGEAKHESVFDSHSRSSITSCRSGGVRRRQRGKSRGESSRRYSGADCKEEQLRREKDDARLPLRART